MVDNRELVAVGDDLRDFELVPDVNDGQVVLHHPKDVVLLHKTPGSLETNEPPFTFFATHRSLTD